MAGRSPQFAFYAACAAAGAIVPNVLLLPWLADHGIDGRLFASQLFATRPATIFVLDVLLAAAVFTIWSLVEGRRLSLRLYWLPAVVTWLVGLGCALPLFLAMRESAR